MHPPNYCLPEKEQPLLTRSVINEKVAKTTERLPNILISKSYLIERNTSREDEEASVREFR